MGYARSVDKKELQDRSKAFAHRCVKLACALPNSALGRHIQDQLIRCSTSVAANYRAACIAQSRAGFIAKLSIVVEEADESCFWLDFITDEKMMSERKVQGLSKEANELTSIFISARKTTRMNSKKMINNKS